MAPTQRPLRCGVILAGGEGKRVQPLVRKLAGVDLPKQYASFIGGPSMLERTLCRAERLLPPERIFTVVARDHLRYPEIQRQTGGRPPHTVVSQPADRGTGPEILLPLMHLFKHHPNSVVAVFPSDHFILQEDLFAAYVRQAFEAVERHPAKIVFLGAEPTGPETEYGYILPDNQDADAASPVRSVKAFLERPEPQIAAKILTLGALWNTMVLVFRTEILLHLIRLSAPELYRSFQRIFRALGTSRESWTVERAYGRLESIGFSKDLLEGLDLHSRRQLSVVALEGVFWSDWGSENRILSVLERLKLPDGTRGLFSRDEEPKPTLASAPRAASL